MDKVIAHFRDGKIIKGHTADFTPGRDWFDLTPLDYTIGGKPTRIKVPELKGIFFVRSFRGDPAYQKVNLFSSNLRMLGQKVRVTFQDGEVLQGITPGRPAEQAGFFVVPADRSSNNQRCFVVKAAVTEVLDL